MSQRLRMFLLGAAFLFNIDKTKLPLPGMGTDLNVRSDPRPGVAGERIVFRRDSGDLDCFLDLRVRTRGTVAPASFRAFLSAGPALTTESKQDTDSWTIRLASLDKPNEKFRWPAGARIILLLDAPQPVNLVLGDWEVIPSTGPSDSLQKARWRDRWFWTSLVLLVLAFVNYVSPTKEAIEELTAEGCVRRIIIDVGSSQGDRHAQSKQAMLKLALLQGLDRATVLAKVRPSSAPGYTMWFQARREFRQRLTRLTADLSKYLGLLLEGEPIDRGGLGPPASTA